VAESVKIGFFGVGALMSKQHLPNAYRNPRFTVHTLCDLQGDRLKKYGEMYDPVRTTTDYKQMLADPDIDMVIIAMPPEFHPPYAIESLRAGKHVYVEKPLAEDIPKAREVAKVVKETGKKLGVGFNRRFAPAYLDLINMIEGDTGPIMINYRIVDDDRDRPDWYRGRPRLLDEACHMFDLFNFIAKSQPVSIFTMECGREGDNQVVVEYENGVCAAMAMSSHGSFAWPKERIEVVGDNKVIAVEDFVELQAAGVPGVTHKNYAGCEFDGFAHGYAKAYEEVGLEFYRYMRRMSCDLLLNSDIFETAPEREKWEVVAERFPEHIRIPINYSCDKGWYNALDQFGLCVQDDITPRNSSAVDGAVATAMSLAAMESLKTKMPVKIDAGACVVGDA